MFNNNKNKLQKSWRKMPHIKAFLREFLLNCFTILLATFHFLCFYFSTGLMFFCSTVLLIYCFIFFTFLLFYCTMVLLFNFFSV